jgi:hypothetical protein
VVLPGQANQEKTVTNPETPRHVEIKDEDDRVVAEAEVTTARGPEGTVRTSMHAKNERARRGDRTNLVDAVMDLPEVQGSRRVEASVPYGDGESLDRLRQRTEDAQTRVAGATTLVDANVRSGAGPTVERLPDNELPADELPADELPADEPAAHELAADEPAGRQYPVDE